MPGRQQRENAPDSHGCRALLGLPLQVRPPPSASNACASTSLSARSRDAGTILNGHVRRATHSRVSMPPTRDRGRCSINGPCRSIKRRRWGSLRELCVAREVGETPRDGVHRSARPYKQTPESKASAEFARVSTQRSSQRTLPKHDQRGCSRDSGRTPTHRVLCLGVVKPHPETVRVQRIVACGLHPGFKEDVIDKGLGAKPGS